MEVLHASCISHPGIVSLHYAQKDVDIKMLTGVRIILYRRAQKGPVFILLGNRLPLQPNKILYLGP